MHIFVIVLPYTRAHPYLNDRIPNGKGISDTQLYIHHTRKTIYNIGEMFQYSFPVTVMFVKVEHI